MIIRRQSILLMLLIVSVCTSNTVAQREAHQQTTSLGIAQSFTLYPPHDKRSGKYDETRACFSFKLGMNKLPNSIDWDLGYGFMQIANEDWLRVGAGTADQRSVMKELGAHNWSDSFDLPALEPLPQLKEGERRQITVDSSADTHDAWAKSTTQFAKAKVGHMYLMHVKNDGADFYVLFRVDQLEQGEQCTISWKLIPTPERSILRSPSVPVLRNSFSILETRRRSAQL